jgi:hypothetical protein
MLCFLCGKKIGLLRSLADQQYCCSAHRQESKLASAQALRDEEDTELWAVSKHNNKKKPVRSGATSSQTASIFAFLTVGALLIAALMMPSASPGTAFPPVSLDPGVKRGLLQRTGDALAEVVRSSAPVTLHQDFSNGWADWTSATLHNATRLDSRKSDGWLSAAAPDVGRVNLRLWNRSVSLKNYQVDFSGQIERRSLSWVFRAADEKNYYATKLLITRPGSRGLVLCRTRGWCATS